MSRTPNTRSRKKALTPGGDSVASLNSTGSYKPSLPWSVQKELGQELENKFPLWKGQHPVEALRASGKQGLAKFLDQLIEQDPNKADWFGKRGDPVRQSIGTVFAYWANLSFDKYADKVRRLGIVFAQPVATTPTHKPKAAAAASTKKVEQFSDEESISSKEEEKEDKLPPIKTVLFKEEQTTQSTMSKTTGWFIGILMDCLVLFR